MISMSKCRSFRKDALNPRCHRISERLRPRASDDLPVVNRLNRLLETAWNKKVFPEPALEVEQLVNRAAERERQDPEGGDWEDGLCQLVGDLQHRARLNHLGRTIAHGLLVRTLRQRIRAAKLWRRHPEIFAVSIKAPVILLGHMRSGTTRLHRMLACDPQFAHTRMYENLEPVRSSRLAAHVRTAALLRFMELCNPRLRQIHPVQAAAAEEEYGLHAFSLHGAMFEAQWAVPHFARWCEQRHLTTVYGEFYRLLQTLRWYRRDLPNKFQVLKAPQFLQDAETVLRTFPGARIIRLVRDRAEVVASTASLVWHQRRVQSDDPDPIEIGEEWKRKTELREQRAAAALSKCHSSAILTVDFDATNRDWRKEVRRVYEFLGMRLDDRVIASMARITRDTQHIGHRYSRMHFGLNV